MTPLHRLTFAQIAAVCPDEDLRRHLRELEALLEADRIGPVQRSIAEGMVRELRAALAPPTRH